MRTPEMVRAADGMLSPRDPQVDELHVLDFAVGEEEVARLHVAVDEAQGVKIGEPRRPRDGPGPASRRWRDIFAEPRLEVDALEPWHHEKGSPFARDAMADVTNDVGVIERREELDLVREPVGRPLVAFEQHLQRYRTTGFEVGRPVDDAHPSRPRHPADLKAIGDDLSGMRRPHRGSSGYARPRAERRESVATTCALPPPS